MEMALVRDTFTATSTTGILSLNGEFFCYVLEDIVRKDSARKVAGKTAIPTGRYQVIISFSSKFKQYMPLLLNVPNFLGIRIHVGNWATDTEGCLLVGDGRETDKISGSRNAYNRLMRRLKEVEKEEKIYISVTNQQPLV